MLAAGQGVLEAMMEIVGLHMHRYDVFNRPTNEVVALVEHLVEEVLVD